MTMLDTKDVSQMFNVSERTIRRWVRDNLIPHVKISKTIRFREDEIFGILRESR